MTRHSTIVAALALAAWSCRGAPATQFDVPTPASLQRAYESRTRDVRGVPGVNYWQLHPVYDLVAELDTARGVLQGSGTLVLENSSPDTLRAIVLRLDQNRFRTSNDDTVTSSGITLRTVELDDSRLDPARINGSTTTVARLMLPKALAPNDSVRVRMSWELSIPIDTASQALRQGRWGTTVFQVAQWYPRLAMYDDMSGWDTVPHTGDQEFFKPFSSYRVSIVAPRGWIVGATGVLTNENAVLAPSTRTRLAHLRSRDTTLVMGSGASTVAGGIPGARSTWIFRADSMSDFAWGASSAFTWIAGSRLIGSRRVVVHSLATERHAAKHAAAVPRALELLVTLSTALGAYPWTAHTLLDGPEGGMEYPALTMSHGEILEHEIPHQWFPMLVGTDESRFDFLDEGLATWLAGVLSDKTSGRPSAAPTSARPALIDTSNTIGLRPVLGYGRGSRMMCALEKRFGRERVLAALRRYGTSWRFKHPTPWDFMHSMEQSLRVPLGDFWRAWLFSPLEPEGC